jgi:hypothetical protein
MNLQQFAVTAFAIESIIQSVKPIYDKTTHSWNIDVLTSLGISILVCVAVGADAFEYVGIPMQIPYLGAALTGIIVSRGANVLHDFLGMVSGLSNRFRFG